MTGKEHPFYSAFITALKENGDASKSWSNPDNEQWTRLATDVIVAALHMCMADVPRPEVAALKHKDRHQQQEYLGIDVVGYNDKSWGPFLWAVEHENNTASWKVQYCAWKLLNLRAAGRVLVTYHNTPYDKERSTHDDLAALLAPVVRDNPGRSFSWCRGTGEVDRRPRDGRPSTMRPCSGPKRTTRR